jgi:hypothetical protein
MAVVLWLLSSSTYPASYKNFARLLMQGTRFFTYKGGDGYDRIKEYNI